MSAITKKLRQLNLHGINKATAIATAQYIEQLEKELSLYKSLESRGSLIRVKFPVNSTYWEASEVILSGDAIMQPIKCVVKDEVQAIMLNTAPNVFSSQAECNRYCAKSDKQRSHTSKLKSSSPAPYISRSELAGHQVEKLRKADRDYYEEHKEEVNQKDRDKYHRLHPNARYYKKRQPKNPE